MEHLSSVALVAVIFMLCNEMRTRASILYPTDGHTVVHNTLINPKDMFITAQTGMTIFGTSYLQCYVDKKGGFYTTMPEDPQVYVDLWLNSELHFVEHPTGKLLLGLITDDTNSILTRATSDVRSATGNTIFVAKEVFVMTFANFTADGTADPPMNTFQSVLIAGGGETYIEFNYPPEGMAWWKDSSGNYPTMMIKYKTKSVLAIPKSGTAEIQKVILKGNTPNTPGRWMFRIDGFCPKCSNSKSGYMLSCIDGNTSICLCSSCDAESPFDVGGLTKEEINVIISISVITGLALIATTVGVGVYYKKHHKK